jgi:hypothetical protein
MRRIAGRAITQRWLLGLAPLPLLVALAFGMAQDLVSGWILQEPREGMDMTADSLQSEFLQANRLLAEGRPGDALVIYESLLDATSELHSGAVHYNAGIAAQSMNRLGSAKAHYLGAASFVETREAALAALAQVDQILPFKMARIPRYPWQKAYDWMTDAWGAEALLIAGSLGLYMACLGGVLLLFTTYRRTGRGLCAFGLAMFALTLGVVLALEHELVRRGTAVVTSPSVALTEDPGTGLESTQIAYEGAVATLDLRMSADYPGWFHVVLENGSVGWLRHDDLQRVFHAASAKGDGAGLETGADTSSGAREDLEIGSSSPNGAAVPVRDASPPTSTPIP